MYKFILFFIGTFGFSLASAEAQTVVTIPFHQNPSLKVTCDNVTFGMTDSGVNLGANVVITGGDGTYTYTWTTDSGEKLGNESVLHVTEYGVYFLNVTDGAGCFISTKFTITKATDISAVQAGDFAVITKAKGIYILQSSHIDGLSQVSVTTIDGRLVKVLNSFIHYNSQSVYIDLTSLPEGNYALYSVLDEKVIVKKIRI